MIHEPVLLRRLQTNPTSGPYYFHPTQIIIHTLSKRPHGMFLVFPITFNTNKLYNNNKKKWILNLTLLYKTGLWFIESVICTHLYTMMSWSLVDVRSPIHLSHIETDNSCVELYIYEWSDSRWSDKSNKLSLK